MKVKLTNQYNQNIDAVFAAFMNPDFVKAKSEAAGARNVNVTISEINGIYTLTTIRDISAKAPGILSKFIPVWSKATQVETWRKVASGSYAGIATANIDDIPVSITGKMSLSVFGNGSVNVMEALVKVHIPFIGSKIERFGRSASQEMFAKEYNYSKVNIVPDNEFASLKQGFIKP